MSAGLRLSNAALVYQFEVVVQVLKLVDVGLNLLTDPARPRHQHSLKTCQIELHERFGCDKALLFQASCLHGDDARVHQKN